MEKLISKKISEYSKHYLSTEPADRKKSEEILKKIWELNNCVLEKVVWVNGPNQANMVCSEIEKYSGKGRDFEFDFKKKKKSPVARFNNFGGGSLSAMVVCEQEVFFEKNDDKLNDLKKQKKDYEIYLNYKEIVKTCGIWYQFESICVAVERPVLIKTIELKNLARQCHCEDGPAVKWADGTELYFMHGISMPKKMVMTRVDKIPVEWYFEEKNVEIRKELFRKINPDVFLKKTKSRLIDTWEPENFETVNNEKNVYALYDDVDLGFVKGKFLKMSLVDKNGLKSVYLEAPPDQSVVTAKDAFYSARPWLKKENKVILS
jgi:hypothetical protein